VEHERRLVHATDALVAGVAPAPGAPAPAPEAKPLAKPELATVEAIAKPPEATPAHRSSRELASAVGWNALLVFAIVLALASLALALAGALGAQF
jgi:hypothetical protein